jgi:hypothetical protein
MLSAVAACGVILWGYCTRSLPRSSMSAIDDKIIDFCTLRFKGKTNTTSTSSQPKGEDGRTQIVTRFLLVLSDQQLVTGLAITTATLSNRCTISLYEFNIVTSLAYFSILTHINCLPMLREHLSEKKLATNCRVFVGSGFLVLLWFVYSVNTVASVQVVDNGRNAAAFNSGLALQCFFLAHQSNRSIYLDISTSLYTFYILGSIILQYIYLVLLIYVPPQPKDMLGKILQKEVYLFIWFHR